MVLDSALPYLIGIDDDILSTGILLYHLKVSETPLVHPSNLCIVLGAGYPGSEERRFRSGVRLCPTTSDRNRW